MYADPDLVRDMGAHLMRDDVFHDKPNAEQMYKQQHRSLKANQQQLAFRAAPRNSRVIDQSSVPRLSAQETGLVFDVREDVSMAREEKDHIRLMQGLENMAAMQRKTHAPGPYQGRDDTSRANFLDRTDDESFRSRFSDVISRLRIGFGGLVSEEKDSRVRAQGDMEEYDRDHRRDDGRYKATKKNVTAISRDVAAPLSSEQQAILDAHLIENVANRVSVRQLSEIAPHNMARGNDVNMEDERYVTRLMQRMLRDNGRVDLADDQERFIEIANTSRKWVDSIVMPTAAKAGADDAKYTTERRTQKIATKMLEDMDLAPKRGTEFQLAETRANNQRIAADVADFTPHLSKFLNDIIVEEGRKTAAPLSGDLRDELERNKVVAQTMEGRTIYQAPAPIVRDLMKLGALIPDRDAIIDGREKIDEVYNGARIEQMLHEFGRKNLDGDVDNNRPSEATGRGARFSGTDNIQSRATLSDRVQKNYGR